ncbi:MAG: T9SS type A sorting domain-containing protein [Chitinophagaceae bacterium]|nr:T9SS type A sorting domain-containing protein [Chitinophagaceae bacterium]
MIATFKSNSFFKTSKKTIISFSILILTYNIIYAQPDLEHAVPANYNTTQGTLSISDRHYRLGEQSLRWDWIAGDTLIIDLTPDEEDEVNPYLTLWAKNHFEMWIHNELPSTDTFEVKFINYDNEDQFRFRFNINYKGWRKMLRSYRLDMLKQYITYNTYKWNVDKIYLLAPNIGSGSIYIDNIQYMRDSEMKYSDRQMPDLYALANDKDKLSSDLYYKIDSLNNSIPVSIPTPTELAGLSSIRNKILQQTFSSAPSSNNLTSANLEYEFYNIVTNDSLIKGKDIEKPAQISQMFMTFTYSYIYNNNTDSKDKAINLLRLMLDCGLAGGSGRWFAGNYNGYNDTVFFKTLTDAYRFIPDDLKYSIYDFLKWSTDVNLGWMDNPEGLFDTDNIYTLCRAYLCTILYNPDTATAVKDLKCLKAFIEKFLTFQPGDTDGMKPDGTVFHHFAHYNGYAYAFSRLIDPILSTLSGTVFQINDTAYSYLRKVVYSQYISSNEVQYANSLCGRNPFSTNISFAKRHFYSLSLIGGDVAGAPFDPVAAGVYIRLYGKNETFPGISAEPFPSGFWQMNYSPLAMYRRNNWAATIKGINNYFWGTEIYPGANRYGRYQSYGAVEIMYPDGLAGSGISAAGWDWNKIPGATTIALPFNSLVLPSSQSKLDEKNQFNFSGGVKFETPALNAPSDVILTELHGNYGMFALNFKQIAATATHNSSFVFRKSFFCFDDKIVCLGSNINNNDAANKTITTLFQGTLPSTSTPTIIDGAAKTGISQSEDLTQTNPHWLIDAYKTGYYVLPGNTIHLERQSQTSPDQSGSGATTTANFANAYIDHGYAPASADYAYVIAPNTTSQGMTTFATSMQSPSTRAFDILQQDTAAHIVRENTNSVTGFSLFLPNNNLLTNDILKSNDAPCVAVMQIKEDTLRISLVNPDLNLVNNKSTAVPITLTLYGSWSKIPGLPSHYAYVLSSEGSQTIVQFNPVDGMPAEIAMIKSNEVILPLAVLSFSGSSDISANQNVLDLTVENDGEAVTYYLERQTSGSNTWTTIADHSFGPATGSQKFSFYDHDIDASDYLYRVKWQQYSGVWKYSHIVTLRNDRMNHIIVAPNPAKGAFTVRLKQKAPGKLRWLLSDISGKVIKQGYLANAIETIAVQGIAPGLYFFHLSTGETIRIILG